MAKPFEPPSESSLSPNRPPAAALLQTGQEAIQRQDYAAAIAALTALKQGEATPAQQVQAQMGLIRAYQRLGEAETAIDLCRPLMAHRNEQVRQWACRRLERLQAQPSPQHAPPAELSPTAEPAPPVASPRKEEPAADLSGFTPLTAKTPTANLTVSLPSPQAAEHETSQPIAASEEPATSSAPDAMNDRQPRGSSADDEMPAYSLFHYQQLNHSGFSTEAASDSEAALAPPPEMPGAASDLPPAESAVQIPRPEDSVNRPLPPLSPLKLWFVTGLTAIVLLGVMNWLVVRGLALLSDLSRRLHQLIPQIPSLSFQANYTQEMGFFLVALLLASPWVMDFLLRRLYRQQTLSPRQFKLNYPEALKTVRQACQQRGWTLPELRLLPTEAPICFSYGWWPSYMRIVVSQGLIDQLEDSELATLYAYELGHMRYWELPVMSGLGTLLFLLHQAYWQTARWADRQSLPALRGLAGLLASFGYALFWLLRKVGLWLSRLRSLYCDRTALALTRNPQGFSQSLIKLTQHTASYIEQQGYTPPLLESLDLLTPLSHHLALSPGSCLTTGNLAALTAWDRQNPYRQWLSWNLPQAPLGERLATLDRAGASLGLLPAAEAGNRLRVGTRPTGNRYLPTLLAQRAPLAGLLIGIAVALLLWFLGGIMQAFDGWFLSWLYQDVSVLRGFAFLGLGIGLLLSINRLFPDIRSTNVLEDPSLESLLKNPLALPADSQPVKIQGTLIGRSGVANWLCQDVILKTPSGLIRLHILTTLGPLSNFFSRLTHPETWRDRTASVTGWLRRGATVWVDVDRVQLNGKFLQFANHPIWTTLLSLIFCGWGVYILFRGY
jgi:Zn-dependent protease with chaperone function